MKLFAHTKWDIAPVLAAVAHLLFNVYLIVGFSIVVVAVWLFWGGLFTVSIPEHQQHRHISSTRPTSRSGGSIAPSACLS